MWENENNSTGLPAMEAETHIPSENCWRAKQLMQERKHCEGKQEVHTFMGRRPTCLQAAQLPPQPAALKYQ